jgi:putative oxidoreductase
MLIRRLARPLLASIFVYGGIQVLRDTKTHAKAAAPLVDTTARKIKKSLPEKVPTDPETLVRIDGVVKLGAGTLLALGKWPRLAALLLSGSIIPTTLAAHSFWQYENAEERSAQQIQFLKNVGLLGGLLITAVDTEGKPSLAYRARRGAHRFAEQTHQTVGAVKSTASKVGC